MLKGKAVNPEAWVGSLWIQLMFIIVISTSSFLALWLNAFLGFSGHGPWGFAIPMLAILLIPILKREKEAGKFIGDEPALFRSLVIYSRKNSGPGFPEGNIGPLIITEKHIYFVGHGIIYRSLWLKIKREDLSPEVNLDEIAKAKAEGKKKNFVIKTRHGQYFFSLSSYI